MRYVYMTLIIVLTAIIVIFMLQNLRLTTVSFFCRQSHDAAGPVDFFGLRAGYVHRRVYRLPAPHLVSRRRKKDVMLNDAIKTALRGAAPGSPQAVGEDTDSAGAGHEEHRDQF